MAYLIKTPPGFTKREALEMVNKFLIDDEKGEYRVDGHAHEIEPIEVLGEPFYKHYQEVTIRFERLIPFEEVNEKED